VVVLKERIEPAFRFSLGVKLLNRGASRSRKEPVLIKLEVAMRLDTTEVGKVRGSTSLEAVVRKSECVDSGGVRAVIADEESAFIV